MPNVPSNEAILMLIFIMVAIASGADLKADLAHGASVSHVAKEAVIVAISLISIIWLFLGLRQQTREIGLLKQELKEVEKPDSPPMKYVLEGRKTLGNVISKQFAEWKLTDSEVDVGWLLLKGLSLKEIALVRNTLEKTVRQQASSLYKKANVRGRHAFSAWFIEDIL